MVDERRAHPRLHHCLGYLIHMDAAGIGKTSDTGPDHLHAVQTRRNTYILRAQVALKGNQKTGPDHRVLIRRSAPQKLLAGMGMTVYKAGHQKISICLQHLRRAKTLIQFFRCSYSMYYFILHRHRDVFLYGKVSGQNPAVPNQNIAYFSHVHTTFSAPDSRASAASFSI